MKRDFSNLPTLVSTEVIPFYLVSRSSWRKCFLWISEVYIYINCSSFNKSIFTNQAKRASGQNAHPHFFLWSSPKAGFFISLLRIVLPSPISFRISQSLLTIAIINRCSFLLLWFSYRSPPTKYTTCSLKTEFVFSFLCLSANTLHSACHRVSIWYICWMNAWIALWLFYLKIIHNLFLNYTQFEFQQFKTIMFQDALNCWNNSNILIL